MTTPEPTSAAEAFLAGALPRVRRFMLVLAVAGIVVCLIFFPWQATAGFLGGALISYFNHRALERGIDALGERITTQGSRERGGGIVLGAALRYVLIAVGCYVIFSVSRIGLFGFLGGVCLPFAAIACEVAVEAYVMLRRGT